MNSLAEDNNPRFAKKFYLLLTMCVTAAAAIAVSLVIAAIILKNSY
jgi:hypothetical protein